MYGKPKGLRRTLALNGNVSNLIKIMLADQANEAVFTSPTRSPGWLRSRPLNKLGSEALVVETIHIDALAADGEILPATAVKIDLEGAELRVLESIVDVLSWIRVRYVFYEVHGPSDHRSSIEAIGDSKAEPKKYLHVSTIEKVRFENYVLAEA